MVSAQAACKMRGELSKATPIATTLSQSLLQSFFARPAEVVAPELIGCVLVKRQADGTPVSCKWHPL